MTANTPVRSSLAGESLLFAGRLFTRWRRAPTVPIQALLFPTFFLITYKLLVGKSIVRITGTDSLYGLVPMCAVAGAMFGALGAGLTIIAERDSGLLSQLWMLPVNRASALIGRLLAEAARTLAGTVLITAVGVALGLRFEGGWLAMIPFVLVPVLVVLIFSTAVIAIAVRSKSSALLVWLSVPSITLVFASSGVHSRSNVAIVDPATDTAAADGADDRVHAGAGPRCSRGVAAADESCVGCWPGRSGRATRRPRLSCRSRIRGLNRAKESLRAISDDPS